MDIFALILILGLGSPKIASAKPSGGFSVLDYGAVGDGITDNSQVFLKTWNATCNSETENPTMIVPEGNMFLVNPVDFRGPCLAGRITFQILGTIVAPASPDTWEGLNPGQWLAFKGVSGFIVTGSGTIDGQGSGWWNQSCRDHPGMGCTSLAPTALQIFSCIASTLSDVNFINSSQTHVLIMGSNNIYINNVTMEAPQNSPNTDGIHIQSSHNVTIKNSKIGTGDDCISIGDYTSNVDISFVECGPGHGISIGSLGRGGNFVQVENIRVSEVYLKGTTNGARIKTWQVGRGYVRNVIFQRIYFDSVKNPIIIDQNYCNVRGACKEQKTGVHISDVVFNGLFGTSSTDVAINLNCSQSVACTGMSLQSIRLESTKLGKEVISTCNNAHGKAIGAVQPSSCLQD